MISDKISMKNLHIMAINKHAN